MAEELDINEGLTRREVLKKGAMLSGALIWAVPTVQRVGVAAAQAEEVSRICKPQLADSYRDVFQGQRKNGTNVLADRSLPGAALTGPDGSFFSLGFGGTITFDFGTVYTFGGANVLVVEVTIVPSAYPEELAQVQVSKDLALWTTVGVASSKAALNQFAVPLLLDSFRYVKLTDISNPALFPDLADGFDIDVVRVTCLG